MYWGRTLGMKRRMDGFQTWQVELELDGDKGLGNPVIYCWSNCCPEVLGIGAPASDSSGGFRQIVNTQQLHMSMHVHSQAKPKLCLIPHHRLIPNNLY